MKIPFTNIEIGLGAGVKQLTSVTNLDVSQPEKAKIIERVMQRQLTRVTQDLGDWRVAIDRAEAVSFPQRVELMRIFQDVILDAHITSLIQSRTLAALSKPFKVVGEDGVEDEDATALLKASWFNKYLHLVHEANYYGYSLIQFGAVVDDKFTEVKLVPRENVEPNNDTFYPDRFNQGGNGIDFLTDSRFKDWLIWVDSEELGILNKATPLYIWKKNALSAWSEYSEIFGHPFRLGKTNLNNPTSKQNMEQMLDNMGRSAWGVFGKDDIIEFITASGSTGENIYDKLTDKVNAELSKLIFGQTMTSDDGSSKSQSEVHERTAATITAADCKQIENNINDVLLPFMVAKGFPLQGKTFTYILDEGLAIDVKIKADTMLLQNGYKLDPDYILKTYDTPVLEEEEIAATADAPQIFQYHIENGVVTNNEVRERLGFPPVTDAGADELKALRTKLQTMKEATASGLPVRKAAELAGIDTNGLSDEEITTMQNKLLASVSEGAPGKKLLANSGLYTEITRTELSNLSNLYKPFNKDTSFLDIITDEERLETFTNVLGEDELEDLLNKIYTGVINVSALPLDLYTKIADRLFTGVKKGFGADFGDLDIVSPDFDLLEDFRVNTHIFSGAKTFQEVKSLQSFVVDADGFVRPFADFKDDALKVHAQYNLNWLEAEFNTAIARSRSGREWLDIKADEEATPFLEYFTVGDLLVRDDHARLDGVIQPVNSKFWDQYLPPNGWNCRCRVLKLRAGDEPKETKITKENSPDLPKLFNNNPGKSKVIFNKTHPYFTTVPTASKDVASKNFGLPIPENPAKPKIDVKKGGSKNG